MLGPATEVGLRKVTRTLERIGSELSLFSDPEFSSDWHDHLTHFQAEVRAEAPLANASSDLQFLFEIYKKILLRGSLTFPTYDFEWRVIETYGAEFSIREDPDRRPGAISYRYSADLGQSYRSFVDFVDPWAGDATALDFDPEHPENERDFFGNLVAHFGSRIPHYLHQQVELEQVLPAEIAKQFAGQRADFLLAFPDGQGLVLEPGDHTDASQVHLDGRRDAAFSQAGIPTLRFANDEIEAAGTYSRIARSLELAGLTKYLNGTGERSERQLALNYLVLLPTLIARLEYMFALLLLRRGLIDRPSLSIAFYERDLQCAEWVMLSFLDRIQRLSDLYGLKLSLPNFQVGIIHNPDYAFGELDQLRAELKKRWGVSFHDIGSHEYEGADLVIDAAIKCNGNTQRASASSNLGVVRSSYRHNNDTRFSYLSTPRSIVVDQATPYLLETFLQDFFRKTSLREGQFEILENVLSQKPTIGLLPTSAGKSICYQMAGILTPGTTIVVDPLVALMQDQVQGLDEQYRINRAVAWYAGSVEDDNVGHLLASNLFVFISPERLLRPGFRQAMRSINAADLYINHAVVDEAHCVSMWGHDFRPSYLNLERNFRKFCTFQGHEPVIVALTGTASQLVLIDLKRELNIVDLDSIVRPRTFDRPELTFNLVRCPNDDKEKMLETVLGAIGNRLGDGRAEDVGWGIVFTHTVRDAWDLFGKHVGEAKQYVRTVLAAPDAQAIRYGIYTGSPPKGSGIDRTFWDDYKQRTLHSFKQGYVRILFGNKAVSVGIDNEYLNFTVNYAMPESLEAYYQQAGRAGRSGQSSFCYLIFSDDKPNVTKQWLEGELAEMPKRWDDLGTVGWFHARNFPGRSQDKAGANKVFKSALRSERGEDGSVVVWQQDDRTEKYVSYWVMLGVIEDYEVSGFGKSTRYRIRLHPAVEDFLQNGDSVPLEEHLIGSLHTYLNRYRPISKTEVEAGVRQQGDGDLSKLLIGYLIDFLYDQIVYQRREAVRSMVEFCNQPDTSPELLRARIRAYFDRSEKFSDHLDAMAESGPDYPAVGKVIDLIEGYDDVENLYWETRRLLDERYRPDWAAISLFSVLYRERRVSQKALQDFNAIVRSLEGDFRMATQNVVVFLAHFLSDVYKLDQIYGEKVSLSILLKFIRYLGLNGGAKYLGLIQTLLIDDIDRAVISLEIATEQMKELSNVARRYSRVA